MSIWASSTSPEATPVGTPTVTEVTGLLASVKVPAFTKLIDDIGVGPAVGVGVAVAVRVAVAVGVAGGAVPVGVAVAVRAAVAVTVGVGEVLAGMSSTACAVMTGKPPVAPNELAL
jgi:hypothetical protein